MANTRVTIVDVAKRAGVAISSASSALNGRAGVSEQTRERVREAAASLGYVPSVRGRSLSAQRAFAIGLVLERSPDVLEFDPFFGAFIGGIEEALAPRGYALVLQQGFDKKSTVDRYREVVASRRVDGVLINEVLEHDWRAGLVRELEVPAVAILPPGIDLSLPSVRQASATGITELIELLVRMGHRRIAHVSGVDNYVHTVERETAWRSALLSHGLEPSLLAQGHFTFDGGRAAADQLLGPKSASDAETRPTAIVCANDLSAVGVIIRALELGYRIPEDLSVTGFDGIAVGTYIRPTLTTVQTTPRTVGRAAASLLLDVIESASEEQPGDVTVPPGKVIVRESTGPAPVTDR